MALLTALHGFKEAGVKLPVNLVLVAEGEEEIGSTNFPRMLADPEVRSAVQRSVGVMMPSAGQSRDGSVSLDLGARGVVEMQLVSSGERWGRGPAKDIHSSQMARVDNPAWRLVKALDTLVAEDGFTPAIDGWFENVRPLTPRQKELIAADLPKDEESYKKLLGVQRWIKDEDFLTSAYRLASQPTVNIQGLVSGYIGPGGKTVLPGRAEAKLDLRLVPDMTKEEAVAKLNAHLAKRGFDDIEVIVSGGYSPTESPEDSIIIRAGAVALQKAGIEYSLFPRRAGSWPGVVFTGPPLEMAAGHFGIGRGGGAHAPDEWLLIESSDPKVAGFQQQAVAFADYLFGVAHTAGNRN
jgi:acetylornithine deacetylase/succinyl-diaminopimelate desuccinylase-like protein